MTRKCSKKVTALIWALLECMFFSSVVLGWTWLSIVFRTDGYFPEYCNITQMNFSHLPITVGLASTAPPKMDPPKPKCRSSRGANNSSNCNRGSPPPGTSGGLTQDASTGLEIRWTRLMETHSLERFKRGEPTNLSSVISSSRSSLASVTRSSKDDVFITHDTRYLTDAMGSCRERLRVMFALIIIVRDLLTFPMGIFFDKYGTTRTRLLTVLIFALGTLMMTFTSASVPWLFVPALALTGVAGSAILLTNLQTANLFGRRRHVVISLYVGAAYSNGVITWLMMLSHFKGVDIQTSFMFLTIGIVPILVSTVAFLPKTRIPWPLPADYGKRRNQSLDEAMLRKQRAWQRRMSEVGATRCRRPPPPFTPSAVQPLFVWSLLWFGIQKLHEAVFETSVVEIASMEIMGPLDFENYFGMVQLLAVFCSPLVGFLIDRHLPRELGTSQATQQMQRIVPAIAVTSFLAFLEIVVDMFSGAAPKAISTQLNVLHKVFTHSTMCAFVMHLHFNHQHLGKFYGLSCAVSAIIAAFQFPVWTFLAQKYSSMLPVHILLLLLAFISFAHPINAWDHCRKRLIRDQSDQSNERCSRATANHHPLSVHIETDSINLPLTKDGTKMIFNDETSSIRHTSQQNAGSFEMSEVTSRNEGKNGGIHVVLEPPSEDTDGLGGRNEEEEEEDETDDGGC
ncbi:unnamed protein product [Lymnaea stagnalis]|uniref:Uncharacterized protein n=1 Tax=Lymnaea stagnalis TaxID=6523 RepID=A0AAV2IFC2_LYMST